MKGVLITGGAGNIGFNLVEKLIETDCNVTILDLESKDSIKKSFKIKNKVKVVYGDVEDANLVMDLVKRNDIVIDYAGIMPPLANLNESIANSTNFIGTKNIVDAIKEVNPDCILLYMSFISIYGTTDKAVRRLTLDTDSTHPDDYYSISIIRSEDYIKSNLEKFAILRMPIVLTRKNYFINHMKLGRTFDFLAKEDLNDIVMGIMKSPDIHGKVFNLSGFKAKSDEVIERLYKVTGKVSVLNRNLYYGEYEDSDVIEEYIKVDYKKLDDYLDELENRVPKIKRLLRKIVNFPKYLIFKTKSKKSSKR